MKMSLLEAANKDNKYIAVRLKKTLVEKTHNKAVLFIGISSSSSCLFCTDSVFDSC